MRILTRLALLLCLGALLAPGSLMADGTRDPGRTELNRDLNDELNQNVGEDRTERTADRRETTAGSGETAEAPVGDPRGAESRATDGRSLSERRGRLNGRGQTVVSDGNAWARFRAADDESDSSDNSGASADEDSGKVTLCHIPPGNPDNAHTITVGANAVSAHLEHGDTLGPCPGDTTPTDP